VQEVDGILVRHWRDQEGSFAPDDVADIVIEFFAVDIPPGYVAAMAQRSPRPVWFNLEGLTAEDWVEGCHRLPSMHPRLKLTKHFFFPGFTGWNGVLLHEAVGHGLEGDFNRKGISAFSGRIGERVAAKGVTVFDDGSLPGRRGSLTIDDEGTPTERTVLIEDGILVGYMHDRMSARLMGMHATGNGRRQSYAHMPMPRMTNTGMLAGNDDPAEMIASMKRGLYCANFGGGQVDITNGKFVFQCTEAYLVEDGKITAPVKGATLIGDGPSALTKVTMIGHDFDFDPGIGVCGKSGQGVPVGVGQPSLKITGLTVGGTAV